MGPSNNHEVSRDPDICLLLDPVDTSTLYNTHRLWELPEYLYIVLLFSLNCTDFRVILKIIIKIYTERNNRRCEHLTTCRAHMGRRRPSCKEKCFDWVFVHLQKQDAAKTAEAASSAGWLRPTETSFQVVCLQLFNAGSPHDNRWCCCTAEFSTDTWGTGCVVNLYMVKLPLCVTNQWHQDRKFQTLIWTDQRLHLSDKGLSPVRVSLFFFLVPKPN